MRKLAPVAPTTPNRLCHEPRSPGGLHLARQLARHLNGYPPIKHLLAIRSTRRRRPARSLTRGRAVRARADLGADQERQAQPAARQRVSISWPAPGSLIVAALDNIRACRFT